jgi:hypothetical protein
MEDGGQSSGAARLVISLVLMAFFGGVGYAIGNKKGKGLLGLILGSTLGVIGWIVLAFIPGESVIRIKPKKLCRECRKQIPKRSQSCPYCGGGQGVSRPGTKVVGSRGPLRRRI